MVMNYICINWNAISSKSSVKAMGTPVLLVNHWVFLHLKHQQEVTADVQARTHYSCYIRCAVQVQSDMFLNARQQGTDAQQRKMNASSRQASRWAGSAGQILTGTCFVWEVRGLALSWLSATSAAPWSSWVLRRPLPGGPPSLLVSVVRPLLLSSAASSSSSSHNQQA